MSLHVSQWKEVDYVDIEMIKGTNKHIKPEVRALETIQKDASAKPIKKMVQDINEKIHIKNNIIILFL